LDFERVLKTVEGFFSAEGFSWAVIGAVGLHAYGLSRTTSDLDFVTEDRAQPKVLEFLVAQGYATLHVSPGYSNHIHPDPLLGRVDFVYVSGDTSRRIFEGCRTMEFRGHGIPVPRAEHLAAMKVQAMKNDPARTLREMADVRFLLFLPGVDEEEIRDYFERSGLRERYEEIKRLS
jgi:hypothetical protein